MIDQVRALLLSFFAANDVIVQFVHGQVFLVLGVTMGLQWRQRSELELARALPWLAGFGILEAVATWGNSFIPVQAALLPPVAIQDLRFMQLLVYAATFLALLGAGLKLNEPAVPPRVTRYVSFGAFAVITALITVQHVLVRGDSGTGYTNNDVIEAALRYGVCTPAALLVAYGLRQQASHLVGPLHVERVINALRVAGYGFVLYVLVEGLLAPPLASFPANVLNDQTVYILTGIPVGILRAIAGGVITFFFFRALEVFRIEADRLAQALERQKSLGAERERISRELHDTTIQSIYAAGLVLEGARQSIDAASEAGGRPEDAGVALAMARGDLDAAIGALNKTIQGIRNYIYDLRTSGTEENLTVGLGQVVEEFRARTGLPTRWMAEGRPWGTLSAEQRQHVYQIAREALNNIARHAQATRVSVELRYDGCGDRNRGDQNRDNRNRGNGKRDDARHVICLRISDNGTGDLPSQGQVGRGLRNMRERAQLLGGTLDIRATHGKGTVVTLEVNVNDAETKTVVGRRP
ncbi:MAG: sensor histidine kinase [Chloroflexi bacterium]|nr:sensor histidine kinase [Chloroflexota bacterium]